VALPRTLTDEQVADALGWAVKTLRKNRANGIGPAPLRFSRKNVLYLEDDVAAWLMSRRESLPTTPVEG